MAIAIVKKNQLKNLKARSSLFCFLKLKNANKHMAVTPKSVKVPRGSVILMPDIIIEYSSISVLYKFIEIY